MDLSVLRTYQEEYSYGKEEIELSQGQRLRVRSSLDPEEEYMLDYQVPAGKSCTIAVTVQVWLKDAS